ncbi:glycosyltransferase [Candidatus Woesearchaeota archaeon]|nr:glycosyltransferase [Candidatus Woesearchaeota archaeon]
MKVSIIIRTFNEEKNIRRCLESIFRQEADFGFEVIIVDSGSTDKTLKVAAGFPVKIVRTDDYMPGKSLNLGFQNAKGEYCVSLSADAVPADKFWLGNLVRPLGDKRVGAVYGRQLPKRGCNPLEARRVIGTYGKKALSSGSFFSNVNSVYRKELWHKTRFDEKLSSTEDQAIAGMIIKLGFSLFYEPKAAVYHSHNYGILSLYRRMKNNVYNRLKKLEGRRANDIISIGIDEFMSSCCRDLDFVLRKKSYIWVFFVIPYNMSVFAAYLAAAFKR